MKKLENHILDCSINRYDIQNFIVENYCDMLYHNQLVFVETSILDGVVVSFSYRFQFFGEGKKERAVQNYFFLPKQVVLFR